MAASLTFAVQAAGLDAFQRLGRYDVCEALSEAMRALYAPVPRAGGAEPACSRPCICGDAGQAIDRHMAALVEYLQSPGGKIAQAIRPAFDSLEDYCA